MQIPNVIINKKEHLDKVFPYIMLELGDIFSEEQIKRGLEKQEFTKEMVYDLDGTKFYYDDIIRFYSRSFPTDSPNREILYGRVCGMIKGSSENFLYVQPEGRKYSDFVYKEDVIERSNII